MSWDNNSGNKGNKNPWGKPGNDDRGRQYGGGGNRGHGGGQEPPDLDEILRKAQQGFKGALPPNMKGGFIFVLAALVLAVLWLASGLYVVNPGENGVVQRFGKWQETQVEPGLGYHLPAPISTVTIVNVEEIRKMSIGFNEIVTRSGNSRSSIPEESMMLTSDRNIVDLNLVIQWNIKSAEQFLFEIKDQENTIKKVAESAIREVVGQTDMFPIITRSRDAVASRTKAIIQENLDQYNSGVNITQVLIERAEVHPDVQNAFQDVQSAKQDAEDAQNRAQAYREDILPKARGQAIQLLQEAEAYKQSTIAKSQGDAERFNSVYAAYLTGKDVTKERMFLETMEDVLKNANKIIMDDNSTGGVVPYLPLDQIRPSAGNSQRSNAGNANIQ